MLGRVKKGLENLKSAINYAHSDVYNCGTMYHGGREIDFIPSTYGDGWYTYADHNYHESWIDFTEQKEEKKEKKLDEQKFTELDLKLFALYYYANERTQSDVSKSLAAWQEQYAALLRLEAAQ
jgi:hypothetical protein